MTDLLVERFRISCRARRASERQALSTRLRLESIARRELPTALEQAAFPAADLAFGPLRVPLDFDPDAYDDTTVALLWADRIRQAVVDGATAAGRVTAPRAAVDQAMAVARAAEQPVELAGVDTRLWQLAEQALADGAAGDAALEELAAELAVAGTSARLRSLRPEQRRALAEACKRRARLLELRLRLADDSSASARGWSGGPPLERRRAERTKLQERAATLRRAARVLDRAAVRAGAAAAPASAERAGSAPALWTRVGGLVLLYPWLGSLLEHAGEVWPELDPVAVRRLALARVVPDVEAGDADPVVRFLAGDDLELEPRQVGPLPGVEELDERVQTVLGSFAAGVPGFERSSAEFLRREFVIRGGLLHTDVDPVQLALRAMPLDPALGRLAYPIGLVRLPWTSVLAVRIERP